MSWTNAKELNGRGQASGDLATDPGAAAVLDVLPRSREVTVG